MPPRSRISGLPRIRRLARLLRGGSVRGPRGAVRFLYHPDYRQGLTGVPMDALRGERVLAWLLDQGWIGPRTVERPRPASLENLHRVHPPAYLRQLEDPAEVGRVLGLPVSAEEARQALATQRLAAGGTIQALRLALRSGGVAFHLGGGLHHASPTRGTGFCLLNDMAVAIRRLRARGFDAPILVVDLDLHDGNGTRAAFAEDPTVHTYSLHNESWDPPEVVARAVADTSIAFGPGVEDGPYLDLLRRTLPPVVAAHRPALTLYVAGVDPGADDGYGNGRLTRAALLERDRLVCQATRGPLAITLAGGYGSSAWRPTARLAAWLVTGRVEEPPDDVEVALERARRSWGAGSDGGSPGSGGGGGTPEGGGSAWTLRGTRRSRRDDPFAWTLEPGDLSAAGAPEPPPTLLLGRLDLARIRTDLERFGILAQLRNRGYPEPLVELQAATGLGPVVRVWGEAEARHLLAELRVELDRATLPDHPMLRVEWLLLQDPRAPFTPARPPLPGQEHPGLGALADVVAWLVTLCRELGLHGILFRTAHWHVAALAARHVRFLSEEDATRFAQVREANRGRPLGRTAPSTPWEDVVMVIPVGPALEPRDGGPTQPPGGSGPAPGQGVT
jgi:acetoin utilization deacetylase AcuC-like enzyme